MKELRKIIQEVLEKEMKTQNSFDWKKYYPDNFKNNLEIEGDNVVLYHYGTDGGTGFLSPKFFGKYSYTLSDVKQWNKPRVFFYVHRKDKELRVTGKEYEKAKTYDDYEIVTELAFDNMEVGLVFKPRWE